MKIFFRRKRKKSLVCFFPFSSELTLDVNAFLCANHSSIHIWHFTIQQNFPHSQPYTHTHAHSYDPKNPVSLLQWNLKCCLYTNIQNKLETAMLRKQTTMSRHSFLYANLDERKKNLHLTSRHERRKSLRDRY